MQGSRNTFYGSKAWKSMRQLVLIKANFRCSVCGGDVSRKGYSRVDHIVPLSKRPDLALSERNLRVLCGVVDPVAKTHNCDAARHRNKAETAERPPVGIDGLPPGW